MFVFALTFSQDATLSDKKPAATTGGATADTIATAGTLSKTIFVNAYEEHTIATQLYLYKVSGTPDSCVVTTYGSMDNINFISIDSDTVVAGNASKTVLLAAKADVAWAYYKFTVVKDADVATQRVTFRHRFWKK